MLDLYPQWILANHNNQDHGQSRRLGMCGHLMPNICQSFFHSVNFVIDFLPTYCVRTSKDKTMIIIISVGTRAEKQRSNWEQTTFLQTIALNWKEGSKRRRRWRSKTSWGGGSVASQGGWLHLEELWAAHAIAFLRCSPPPLDLVRFPNQLEKLSKVSGLENLAY